MEPMTGWLWRRLRLLLPIAIGLAVLPAYLRAFTVIGPSEAPSITIGSKVLVNEAAYAVRVPYGSATLIRTGSPRRGDMVEMFFPNRTLRIFKRVLGLPGETIELRDNRVLVNGTALTLQPLNRTEFEWVAAINHIGSTVADEDGHWITFTEGASPFRNSTPVRLGAHQYFVIGDNRDDSADSRIWGPVAEDRILGKVILTLRARAAR
jgi:signal peptidase I